MWILKGLLFLVLLFVMVFLVATNQQSVDINFFGRSFLGISIFWVVGVCYLAGVATVFVFSAFREFRWWTADQIAGSEALFAPRRLSQFLVQLVRTGPPSEPFATGV